MVVVSAYDKKQVLITLPSVATQAVVQHINELLAEFMGTLEGPGRDERVVDNNRGLLPEVPVVHPVGSDSVAENVF